MPTPKCGRRATSGLRGRFSYGTPLGHADDKPMDLADLARLKRDVGKDPMLTLGMCSRNGPQCSSACTRGSVDPEMAKKEWGAVRDLGLPITLHTSGMGAIPILYKTWFLAQTCNSCIRLIPAPKTRTLWPRMASPIASRRLARPAAPAKCNSPK